MPRSNRLLWLLEVVMVSAAVGCGGVGQSGSEVIPPSQLPDPTHPNTPATPGIPPTPHCPCDGYRQYQQIRATVIGIEAFPAVGTHRYELIANELLGPDPSDKHEIAVSDHFGGYWNDSLGCGGMNPTPIAKGDEVVAFFRRGLQDGQVCCEYIACSNPCFNAGDHDQTKLQQCQDACEQSSASACAKHQPEAVLHGDLLLIPWGDTLLVGRSEQASVSITRDQLPALNDDYTQCRAALPDLTSQLYPAVSMSEPEQGSKGPAPSAPASSAGSGAIIPPSTPPASPATPPTPSLPPGANSAATPPAAGSGASTPVNTTAAVIGPPPAGPEEVRVRCAH